MRPEEAQKALEQELGRNLYRQFAGSEYKPDFRDVLNLAEWGHRDKCVKLGEEASDSSITMSLPAYIEFVEKLGFVKIVEETFAGTFKPEITEHFFIYWYAPDGILLTFDSFHGMRNGGHFYYNWMPNIVDDYENRPIGVTSSGHYTDSGLWVGDHDCREFMRANLNRLRQHGKFVTPWIERPYLSLSHYRDRQTLADAKFDSASQKAYRQIIADRFARLPQEIRDRLGPDES